MSHRLGGGLLLLVSLTVSLSLAQDPTKVEPRHYRLGFENERVQVVYVYYGPHEKSGMHDHPGGVAVNVTGGHLKFTDENGNTQEVTSKAGEARWFPAHKHKVENLGATPYNAVYIGIKSIAKTAAQDLPPAGDEPIRDEQITEILTALGFSAPDKLPATSARSRH
jgi:quercetin dioxygenase-like cupin family protein